MHGQGVLQHGAGVGAGPVEQEPVVLLGAGE